MNRDRLTRWLYPLLGFLFLAFSLYVLHQELGRYNLSDVLVSLSAISDRQMLAALGFTIAGYFVISNYDLIAFRQLHYQLQTQRILFTTFITYAVSNTTGFTLLIGGGIRYRFYSHWQVPTKKIAKITALGNITFWLGMLTLSGMTFLFNPLQLPQTVNLSIQLMRGLGIFALTLVGIYLYFCQRQKRLRIGRRVACFPKLNTSLAQISIFTLDWALAAAVLYSLLPDYSNKSYLSFLSIYLLAMTISILSNIPGGIGIFETVIIFLLPQNIPAPDILSSLLAYRAIRFLLPLGVAIAFIGTFELRQKLRINRY